MTLLVAYLSFTSEPNKPRRLAQAFQTYLAREIFATGVTESTEKSREKPLTEPIWQVFEVKKEPEKKL